MMVYTPHLLLCGGHPGIVPVSALAKRVLGVFYAQQKNLSRKQNKQAVRFDAWRAAVKIIETDILITSSPEAVWKILTDFATYPEWNPFIQEISGEALAGARLRVSLVPPGGRPVTLKPLVLTALPGKELRWTGHLGLPGFFDGDHVFRIEPAEGDRVRFRQSEQFRGVFVALVPGKLFDMTRRGFEAMNRALKERVEKCHIGTPR